MAPHSPFGVRPLCELFTTYLTTPDHAWGYTCPGAEDHHRSCMGGQFAQGIGVGADREPGRGLRVGSPGISGVEGRLHPERSQRVSHRRPEHVTRERKAPAAHNGYYRTYRFGEGSARKLRGWSRGNRSGGIAGVQYALTRKAVRCSPKHPRPRPRWIAGVQPAPGTRRGGAMDTVTDRPEGHRASMNRIGP